MTEGCWTKVTVAIGPEAVEAVAEILMAAGAGGIEIVDPRVWEQVSGQDHYGELYPAVKPVAPDTPVKVIGYLAGDCRRAPVMDAIKERVLGLGELGLNVDPVRVDAELVWESDWAENWKKFYHPRRVGNRIVIKPRWEDYAAQPGDVVVELDPGMAFGTGEHETTRLCLRQLEKWLQPGWLVYDVGTGSGVLALAAAKLGAGRVEACDLDPVAAAAARENVMYNGLQGKISVEVGTIDILQGQAHLIAANIITDVIIDIVPQVVQRLVDGGLFITSGIILERRNEVVEALEAAGLQLVEEDVEAEWVCLVSRK
ncbi:MAG: 50S ribosomal protein L11 methyltransferase [Firmicutes bacterium]|nr:50S ribosomal protein L11 methyltransferase [Bacillota bacterium]